MLSRTDRTYPPNAVNDEEDAADMNAFLRDYGMDTPEIQEIINEVLQTSTEGQGFKPASFGERFAFKALVYGAPETLEHLVARLDVTGIYCALFMSAQLATLISSDVPVSSSGDRITFIVGFSMSLCAFVANLVFVRAVHANKSNLVRDCDIIVWARHGLDFFTFGSYQTLYLGCIGFMIMGYPVIREAYGVGLALVVLLSFICIFVLLEYNLLAGGDLPSKKSMVHMISGWRSDSIPNDPFSDSVAYLKPLFHARVARAKQLRAKIRARI